MAAKDCLQEGASCLDLATIKDFLRFHVACSQGHINRDKMTVDSLKTYAEWFFAGFTRVTGTVVSREDRHSVYLIRVFFLWCAFYITLITLFSISG
jgi:hypothetical protein